MKVLGVDPSMGHPAAVLINFKGRKVAWAWDWSNPAPLGSYSQYLDAFPDVVRAFRDVLLAVGFQEDQVVHEMPPSGRVVKSESALLAAAALRYAVGRSGYPPVGGVDPRHAKKVVTGNPNATKPQIRQWFNDHLPDWTTLTNEHRRDAALVALAWWLDTNHLTIEDWLNDNDRRSSPARP